MTTNPIDVAVVDGEHVPKLNFREAFHQLWLDVPTVAALRAMDTMGQTAIIIGTAYYRWDQADTTTADDGVNCIIDLSGVRRYKKQNMAVDSHTHSNATTAAAGFMSAADKQSLSTFTIGVPTPLIADVTAGVNFTIFNKTAAPFNGRITDYGFYAPSGGSGKMVVATINGDGTLTKTYEESISYVTGLNAFLTDAPIVAGQIYGLYSSTAMIRVENSINDGYYTTTGLVGTSTAKSTVNTLQMQMYANIEGPTKATADLAYRKAAATELLVGTEAVIGRTTPAATDTAAGAGGIFWVMTPLALAGACTDFSVQMQTAGNGKVIVSTLNGDLSRIETTIYDLGALTVGSNNFSGLNIKGGAGKYLGFWTDGKPWLLAGAGTFGYTASAPSTTVAGTYIVNASYAAQMRFTFGTAMYENVADAAGGGAVLTGVDGGGGGDVTTTFNASYQSFIAGRPVYVPPGTYNITTLPRSGWGLYGDGDINVNSIPYIIPPRPETFSILSAARSTLSPYITEGSIILAGESDFQGFNATSYDKELGAILTRALNLNAEGLAYPAQTIFGTIAARNAATWSGFTPSGTITFADGGPAPGAGSPMTPDLAVGAKYAFTGIFPTIGVWYDKQPGAGTLTVRVQGGATLATINAAAATDLSAFTAVSTGSSASQTYEIECSVATTRLVGVERRGVVPAVTSGIQRSPMRVPVINASRGSSLISNWGAAHRTAAVKMANFGATRTGRPVVFIRQGASDAAAGGTVASLQALLEGAVDNWVAAGADVLLVCYVQQRNLNDGVSPSYPNGHEALVAAHRKAAKSRNVRLVNLERLPFLEAGYMTDGAHFADVGHRMAVREMLMQIALMGTI